MCTVDSTYFKTMNNHSSCSKTIDIDEFKELVNDYDCDKIIIEILKTHPELIKYVRDQSEEMKLIAVSNDNISRYVPSIVKSYDMLESIKNPTLEETKCRLRMALRMENFVLNHIIDKTDEVCLAAIAANKYSIQHIDVLSSDMIALARSIDDHTIENIGRLPMPLLNHLIPSRYPQRCPQGTRLLM